MKKICVIILLAIFAPLSFLPAETLHPRGKNRFVSDLITEKSVLGPDKLVIVNSALNLSGELRIVAGDNGEAIFEYRKVIKTSDMNTAIEYANQIAIDMHHTSNGAKIVLQATNPAPWQEDLESGQIEGILRLPYECRLEINTPYFEVDVSGPFYSMENKSSLASLNIRKITNRLNLSGYHRKLRLQEISGIISIIGGNADIKIEGMRSISTAAEIKNENGDVIIDNFSGAVDLKNSYGRVRLTNYRLNEAEARIAGSQSSIRLELADLVNSRLDISNIYDDVRLYIPDGISAEVELIVEPGNEIHVENLPIRPITAENNRVWLITGDGEPNSIIAVNVEGGGNIFVEGIEGSKK